MIRLIVQFELLTYIYCIKFRMLYMLETRRIVMYEFQYGLRDGGYRCSPTLFSTLSHAFTSALQYSRYNTVPAIAGLSLSSLALLRCTLTRCLSVTLTRRCHSFHSLTRGTLYARFPVLINYTTNCSWQDLRFIRKCN